MNSNEHIPAYISKHANKSPEARLFALEDDYSEYRHAVENRLCPDDPEAHARYKAAIADAEFDRSAAKQAHPTTH